MEEKPIRSYRDLIVWQKGMELAAECYRLTKGFPREELYGMTSQIRRAATSVPANIAEGHGREHRSEFIRFLQIAQGSLKELETHLILAARVLLTTEAEIQSFLEACDQLGRQLHSLIRALQRDGAK